MLEQRNESIHWDQWLTPTNPYTWCVWDYLATALASDINSTQDDLLYPWLSGEFHSMIPEEHACYSVLDDPLHYLGDEMHSLEYCLSEFITVHGLRQQGLFPSTWDVYEMFLRHSYIEELARTFITTYFISVGESNETTDPAAATAGIASVADVPAAQENASVNATNPVVAKARDLAYRFSTESNQTWIRVLGSRLFHDRPPTNWTEYREQQHARRNTTLAVWYPPGPLWYHTRPWQHTRSDLWYRRPVGSVPRRLQSTTVIVTPRRGSTVAMDDLGLLHRQRDDTARDYALGRSSELTWTSGVHSGGTGRRLMQLQSILAWRRSGRTFNFNRDSIPVINEVVDDVVLFLNDVFELNLTVGFDFLAELRSIGNFTLHPSDGILDTIETFLRCDPDFGEYHPFELESGVYELGCLLPGLDPAGLPYLPPRVKPFTPVFNTSTLGIPLQCGGVFTNDCPDPCIGEYQSCEDLRFSDGFDSFMYALEWLTPRTVQRLRKVAILRAIPLIDQHLATFDLPGGLPTDDASLFCFWWTFPSSILVWYLVLALVLFLFFAVSTVVGMVITASLRLRRIIGRVDVGSLKQEAANNRARIEKLEGTPAGLPRSRSPATRDMPAPWPRPLDAEMGTATFRPLRKWSGSKGGEIAT